LAAKDVNTLGAAGLGVRDDIFGGGGREAGTESGEINRRTVTVVKADWWLSSTPGCLTQVPKTLKISCLGT